MLKLFCDHDENLKGNDSQLASPERNDNIPSEAMLYGKLYKSTGNAKASSNTCAQCQSVCLSDQSENYSVQRS